MTDYINLPFINNTGLSLEQLISSEYGRRILGSGKHNGIDFALPVGTQIVSVASGIVIKAVNDNSLFGVK